MKKERITELDIFRGICMVGVFFSHLYYDLSMVYPLPPAPAFLQDLFEYGGILFVVLSGICTELGSKPIMRGLVVFSCGMLITMATWCVSLLAGNTTIVVRFGILHALGVCMILSPLLRRLSDASLITLGIFIIFTGFLMRNIRTEFSWLFPIGLISPGFSSGDYWPLFPQLGFFAMGIVMGRRFYPNKKPLFPVLQGRFPLLSAIGKKSLLFYLAQQPVCFAMILLIDFLFLHHIIF